VRVGKGWTNILFQVYLPEHFSAKVYQIFDEYWNVIKIKRETNSQQIKQLDNLFVSAVYQGMLLISKQYRMK